jgi:hypothetical protein
MINKDAQEAITKKKKKMDNEASAGTKWRTRWAGPAPAHRVLPGRPRLTVYWNIWNLKF